MKNTAAKLFFSIMLIAVVISGIVAFAKQKHDTKPFEKKNAVTGESQTDNTPAQPENKDKGSASINFLSVGDNLIHDGIYEQAHRRAGGNGYDFSYCYENIAETVAKADIATINQETIIAKSYQPSGYPQFNSPHEVGDEIVRIGFDVIAMANNHMIDKYEKGLAEAIEYWDSQPIVHTGAYKNTEDLYNVEYAESNGLKVGLVGVTQYTNGLYLPKDSELKIIYSSDEDVIKTKIENAKKECDIVMVNVHWGNEYQTTPTQEQRNLAKKMADWGADIIIGHHPHVIQPVEFIERADGSRVLVAYSLGNFISQQNTPARVVGGMLTYTVTKDFNTGSIDISNVVFTPTVTHYVRGADDVKVYLYSQYTDQLAKRQASRLGESSFSLDYIDKFVRKIIDEQFLKY